MSMIVETPHPHHTMGRRKSTHCKKEKKYAYNRQAIKTNPTSISAKYGRPGHSSYWD